MKILHMPSTAWLSAPKNFQGFLRERESMAFLRSRLPSFVPSYLPRRPFLRGSEVRPQRAMSASLQADIPSILSHLIDTEPDDMRRSSLILAEDSVQTFESLYDTTQGFLTRNQLEVLRVRGLSNTRGLFEYIEEKLLDRFRYDDYLSGEKLSASPWVRILDQEKDLARDLRSIYGMASTSTVAELAAHMSDLYTVLSQHIHLRQLECLSKAIVFAPIYLSPQQAKAMQRAAKSIGVDVVPSAF